MSVYVDSSALLKRYIAETDSELFQNHLLSDTVWVSGRHTQIEVRRNLSRLLTRDNLAEARSAFEVDWARTHVVELDPQTCELAAQIAEITMSRTLDALHLAAAQRVGAGELPILTADLRQAQVARDMGLKVVGI